MHGTYLNGSRIVAHHPTELSDGDEIVFGAEVRRGSELFPACAFRINYEFGPYKATNTYSFPETSDNEDMEGEDDFTDEESENEELSSEDDESVVAEHPKLSQPIQAIDLTRDDSPTYSPYEIIDFTKDSPTKEQVGEGRFADSESDAHSDSDLDRSASEAEVDFSHGGDELDIENASDDDEAIHEDVTAELPADRFECEVDDAAMDSSAYDYDSDAASSQGHPQGLLSSFPSSPTVIKGADRMLILDDEHNDFGLPKAAEEAMRAMADNGLLPANPSSFHNLTSPFYSSTFSANPYHSVGDQVGAVTGMLPSPVIPDTFASASQLSTNGRYAFSNRQPSPSDAAMAKGIEMKDSDIPVSSVRSTANLGQGSGKEEYFQAREQNKAKLQGDQVWSGSEKMIETPTPQAPAVPTARVYKACSTPRMRMMATLKSLEEDKADAEKQSNESSKLLPSPAPTSFEEQAVASLDLPAIPAVAHPVRSVLRIDEIIEQNVADVEDIARKRKADDISNAVEDDIRLWASSLNSVNSTLNSAINMGSRAPTPAPTPAEIAGFVSSTVAEPSVQPPAKKMRKFMENVAYAALGGVAVGAALFSSLVATAPDFM